MPDVRWNEQIKLEATFLNNIGVAIVGVGAVTPILSYIYHPELASSGSDQTVIGIIVSAIAGALINRAACYNLKALE